MPEDLDRFERMGYLWQYKLNGTNSVQETLGNGAIDAYTRHQEPHKLWTPDHSKALEPIRDLPAGFILVGELMHSKVKGGPKDTLYLHDMIQHPTEEMYGETYLERYRLLMELFNPEDRGDEDHLVITPNLWVARNLIEGFRKLFNAIKCPWHEGTVLKNPMGKLGNCSKATTNSGWQVKCRVPHKNYSF
jgi:ATP-dependent DNA ligase